MNYLKTIVAEWANRKNHYEAKSERVRRMAELRRQRRQRRQFIAGSFFGLALCTIITSGVLLNVFAAEAASEPEPVATEDTIVEPRAASVEVAEDVATEEQPAGVTTTRLGVIVDSYDPNTDYTTLMNELIDELGETDDVDLKLHLVGLLEIYETQRNIKVEDLYQGMEGYSITSIFSNENTLEEIEEILFPHVSYYTYTENDAIMLARIIYAEGGSSWITDAHQRDIASVVMNRVTDPRFPDNIYDVLHAPGQYPGSCDNTKYDERCLSNAIYVLENGPTTTGVWQANFKQGSEVLQVYDYPGHSVTYICR